LAISVPKKKLDYTVIGDGVNLTSRLESLTKYYHCPILISQETFTAVKDHVCCRLVDYVKVKGKQACTFIYEPLLFNEDASQVYWEIAALAKRGFDLYRQRRFVESSDCYDRILKLQPNDCLSQLLRNRCNEYSRVAPEATWQGACVFEAK
jgi:adenylate cyclase